MMLEDESPLKRLMVAQYDLVGSALGLMAKAQNVGEGSGDDGNTLRAANWNDYASLCGVKIVLKGVKRPVRLRCFEMAEGVSEYAARLQFFCVSDLDCDPMEADLVIAASGVSLTIMTQRGLPSGCWRAAVCNSADEQIGFIEIEL
jgi:hypothetical protein